jgi:beta-glucosidase
LQFPFGYGLSYTDFEIANHKLKQEENCIEVSADIKNIGPVDGDEVL